MRRRRPPPLLLLLWPPLSHHHRWRGRGGVEEINDASPRALLRHRPPNLTTNAAASIGSPASLACYRRCHKRRRGRRRRRRRWKQKIARKRRRRKGAVGGRRRWRELCHKGFLSGRCVAVRALLAPLDIRRRPPVRRIMKCPIAPFFFLPQKVMWIEEGGEEESHPKKCRLCGGGRWGTNDHTYPWGCGLGGGSQYIRV